MSKKIKEKEFKEQAKIQRQCHENLTEYSKENKRHHDMTSKLRKR